MTPPQTRYTDGKSEYEKNVPHMSSGRCKLKRDATTYILEWPKSRTLRTPNAGEDMELQELSLTASRNIKWQGYSGRQLAVSQKTKHTLANRQSHPQYLSKEAENLHPHKHLPMDVYSSFTRNCQNLEGTKMPFSRWMGKPAHPDNAVWLRTKKKWAMKRQGITKHTYTHKTINAYCWGKTAHLRRLDTVGHQLHDTLEKAKSWRQ